MSGSQVYLQSFGQVCPASIEHAIAKNGSEDEGQPGLPRTAGHRSSRGGNCPVERAFRRTCQKEMGLLASSAGGAATE